MQHIASNHVIVDMDTVFIISQIPQQIPSGSKHVCTIPTSVFQKVQGFVRLFDEGFQTLLKKDNNKNAVYWETDCHDKFTTMLQTLMPNCQKVDISNALLALGY